LKKLIPITLVLLLAGCASPTYEDARQAEQDGDFDSAAEIWSDLADEGDGRALLALYRLYEATGVGFRNDREARRALRRLAREFESPAGQFLLGKALLEERDIQGAREWINRSADQGYAEAERYRDERDQLLGRMIRTQNGSPAQQAELGNDLYFGNHGVPQDYEEAAVWYRKAAERDHVDAQATLAYQYLEGLGVEKDEHEAYAWYREAALKGHPSAQGNLGYLYGEGRGTDQDDIKAYAWSVLASENGYGPAERNKEVYLDRLSNQQRLQSLNEIRRLESIIQR